MATASASAVFTAVNGSIGSINTVIGWVDRLENFLQQYAEAGETIRDIQETALARMVALQQWRDFWDIKTTTKYPYQRELWGDTQFRIIHGKICSIEDLCTKFSDEVQQFCRGENTSRLLQNSVQRNSSISTLKTQAAFRQDAKDNVKDVSAWQILSFVRTLKPQATEWDSRLKTMLAELSEIADAAFFAKHKEKVLDRLTANQLDMIKRSTFLGMIVSSRLASEELYRSCLEAERVVGKGDGAGLTNTASTSFKTGLTGTERGIILEDVPSQKGAQLLFHLVLDWEEPPQELCVQGPVLDLDNAKNIGPFIEAYKAILRNETASILIEPDLYFLTRGPYEHEKIYPRSGDDNTVLTSTLAELLHALDESNPDGGNERLPRTQRLSLAFKIAECGLLLAGTSWLSKLHSVFIRRSARDPINQSFTIDTGDTIQDASNWSLYQLARNMFRIGKLLIELGTGELVREVRPRKIGKLHSEEYLMCEKGLDCSKHGQWISIPALLDTLDTSMGEKYARATADCLGKMRDECGKRADGDNRESYKQILGDYYVHVYTPLKELAREADWKTKHLEEIQKDLAKLAL